MSRMIVSMRAALALMFVAMIFIAPYDFATVLELLFFFPIGIFGAIIANATGTGGGVVFVPIFSAIDNGQLMLGSVAEPIGSVSDKSVGMSFAIQCFGMTMGATVWLKTLFIDRSAPNGQNIDASDFQILCFATLAACLPAMLFTQWITTFPSFAVDSKSILFWFKVFSLILGLILLIVVLRHDRFAPSNYRFSPSHADVWGLLGIGLIGGIVTSFFSVGVGEFLAVFLILRRFPTHIAVGVAVVVSAITVWTGVWFHVVTDNIIYEIILCTIPGAVVGGLVAKRVAFWLGSERLKTLAALWIVGSSSYLLLT